MGVFFWIDIFQSHLTVKKNKEIFKSIKINDSENLKQVTEPYNYCIAIAKLLLGCSFQLFYAEVNKVRKKEIK
jgi:hypothetical protein